ncbi:MAG TPA: DbpA RNA binding domain-containing protein [Gemmatimonadales bacterium]|nr:DbpA RNA binding domain-containing protein [Gemmatimonadales bacterium]
MAALEALHLSTDIAAAMDRLGWRADDALMRDASPTAARGHNLVLVLPPSPTAASPALAGLLSRLGPERPGLLLAPANQLDEWNRVAHRVLGTSALRVQAAHGTSRATRRLRDDGVDLLIATPETAVALQRRSALRAEALGAVLLAWPEAWEDEESLSPLMQDLDKDAQRIVLTSSPERGAALVERYARRALTVGTVGESTPVGPVRTVSVPWERRVAALGDLVELLDPTSLVIWTADRGSHEAIAAAAALREPEGQVVTGDAPKAQTIIAFDLPDAERLRQLAGAGELVLLVPPGAEPYVERIAAPRRPLRLPGALDAATTAAAARRAAIVRALETGTPDRALLTLAPLFERHDPTAVAAALYELWTSAAGATAPAALPDIPATSRVFVGIGKKDGATVNDLVAVLTKDVRLDRSKIGRVELRDAFALVELPAQDAERVASALNGTTIRRRRITARVDRGGPTPRSAGPTRTGTPRRPARPPEKR